MDSKHHSYLTLIPVVCWCIWLARNNLLFDGGMTIPKLVASKVLLVYNVGKDPPLHSPSLHNRVPMRLQENVGWFNGATVGDKKNSGAEGIIGFNQINVIKWTFNIGAGTNNRAELLGVWSTLYLSKIFNISMLQIIGDSKLRLV